MPRILLDFDPPQPDAPQPTGDSSDLVYFLSFAFSSQYGAQHPLALAALVMRAELKIDLRPLLTFADRDVDEPADADILERAWQDAAPLAECCARVVEAMANGERRLLALREEYPGLQGQIAALGRIAGWAAGRGARIRVTYSLEA